MNGKHLYSYYVLTHSGNYHTGFAPGTVMSITGDRFLEAETPEEAQKIANRDVVRGGYRYYQTVSKVQEVPYLIEAGEE